MHKAKGAEQITYSKGSWDLQCTMLDITLYYHYMQTLTELTDALVGGHTQEDARSTTLLHGTTCLVIPPTLWPALAACHHTRSLCAGP